MTEKLNIYQKMLQATMQIEKVAKNLSVSLGKERSYKAVSEGDVLRAVKPIEIELGIFSYPFDRTIVETQVLTTKKEYNGNTTESNQLLMRIETIYRFVNVEKPDEFVDVKSYGDGVDSGDKAPGKAMTYADKYALLKAYKIETGDDPDKDGSGELKKAQSYEPKATKAQIETLTKAYSVENIQKITEFYKVKSLEEITSKQASAMIAKLEGK
jgi:hypothetical protein